jgi:hypothetical protein
MTYIGAKAILEKAPEKLKEKVRKGKVSINYAYSYSARYTKNLITRSAHR